MAENEKKVDARNASHEDTVLAVTRYADGTPKQSPNFRSVDPEWTAKISESQLKEQAVSAADHAIRSERLKSADGDVHHDAGEKELIDAHEAAAKSARQPEKLG